MLKIPMRGAIDRHDKDFDSGAIFIHVFALAQSWHIVYLS